MIDLASNLDPYSRKARVFPAMLVATPLIASALAFPGLKISNAGLALAASIAVACGIVFAVSNFARSAGKRCEPKLLKEWGGWPTTLILSGDSTVVSNATVERYRAYLRKAVPGFPKKPVNEKQAFASAVEWLKEQRRGPEFSLVHKENAEYGFRRNCYGLKAFGLLFSGGASGVVGYSLAPHEWSATAIASAGTPGSWLAFGICLAILCWWLFVVSKSWVREGADAYAIALLASCDWKSAQAI